LFTSYRAFKNRTLYPGINNLFDKQPPFNTEWTSGADLTGHD
jgi:iron complex outermembrane recepter protein